MNDFYQPAFIPGSPVMTDKPKEKAQTPGRLIVSAAIFGAAFSYLFAKQFMGVNALVFVLLLYGFALLNRKLFMKRTFGEEKLITLFSLPVLFLAAYTFIGSTFVNALSILVILFVMFVQYLVLSGNAVYRWYQPLFFLDLLFGSINRMLLGAGQFVAGGVNGIFKKQSENKKGVVIGVLAGIVLLILIVPLLLMSDPNVSERIRNLFSNIYLGDVFLYLFLFLVGASAAAAPIATARRGEYTGKREVLDFEDKRPVQGVTTAVALTMIVSYMFFSELCNSHTSLKRAIRWRKHWGLRARRML